MAFALLGRRHGRLLVRAAALAESCSGSGALGRLAYGDEVDVQPETCSTSGQSSSAAGGWPRSMQLRRYAVNNKPTIRYEPVPEPEHDDFSTEPTTYTQLLSALHKAKSIKRLQHLVTSCSDRLDSVHVAAAVARLPYLIKYREADLIDQSDVVVVPTKGLPRQRHKPGAKPKASHVQEGARLAAQLDALIPLHAQHFFPRQAACSIWAFGELRQRGIVERMSSLPDALLAITKGNLEPLRVHGHGVDFAQLLQGLAKLGYQDQALLARLVPLLQERLGSMQQRELQMSVWGLAGMDYADPDVFNAVADQLLKTGTAFSLPSGCASVFWAYAKARVKRPDLFKAVAGTIIAQALLIAPNDVYTALWACTKLGYQDPQLFGVLGDALVRSLGFCSDTEAAASVDALARLGYHHAPLMDAVCASILAEPVIGAEPLNIVHVLDAFGRLGRRGPKDMELVAKLAVALVPRLPIMRGDLLAYACASLERFGYRDETVISAIVSRAEVLLPGITDVQLVLILRFLGSSGYVHFQLAVASARHLHAVILGGEQYRSVRDLVELLYRCARQGVEDPEAADAVLALAASHTDKLRPVDAARLLVIGQVMNKQTPLLAQMEEVVSLHASSLDPATLEVALQTARILGRTSLVSALQGAVDAKQQGAVAATGM